MASEYYLVPVELFYPIMLINEKQKVKILQQSPSVITKLSAKPRELQFNRASTTIYRDSCNSLGETLHTSAQLPPLDRAASKLYDRFFSILTSARARAVAPSLAQ